MRYAYESDYFIDPAWYDVEQPTPPPDGGPYGGPSVEPYVDKEVAADVVNDLLQNIVMARETGNNDAIIASYAQTTPGDFGEVQEEFDAIRANAEAAQKFSQEFPDYPVSSLTLDGDILVGSPVDNKDTAAMTFTVINTTYGNYRPGQDVIEFKSRETWNVTLVRQAVSGWSDKPAGQYTTMWLISDNAISSIETIA